MRFTNSKTLPSESLTANFPMKRSAIRESQSMFEMVKNELFYPETLALFESSVLLTSFHNC
jgi:hypothetical protein